jgi:hypothetical protein
MSDNAEQNSSEESAISIFIIAVVTPLSDGDTKIPQDRRFFNPFCRYTDPIIFDSKALPAEKQRDGGILLDKLGFIVQPMPSPLGRVARRAGRGFLVNMRLRRTSSVKNQRFLPPSPEGKALRLRR